MSHAIERTSPKGEGQKFVGYCIKCGQENLGMVAATQDCPSDSLISDEQALGILINPKGYS